MVKIICLLFLINAWGTVSHLEAKVKLIDDFEEDAGYYLEGFDADKEDKETEAGGSYQITSAESFSGEKCLKLNYQLDGNWSYVYVQKEFEEPEDWTAYKFFSLAVRGEGNLDGFSDDLIKIRLKDSEGNQGDFNTTNDPIAHTYWTEILVNLSSASFVKTEDSPGEIDFTKIKKVMLFAIQYDTENENKGAIYFDDLVVCDLPCFSLPSEGSYFNPGSPLKIFFGAKMDKDTINRENITLSGGEINKIEYDPHRRIAQIEANLVSGSTYTLTISPEIKLDQEAADFIFSSSYPLESPTTIQFFTEYPAPIGSEGGTIIGGEVISSLEIPPGALKEINYLGIEEGEESLLELYPPEKKEAIALGEVIKITPPLELASPAKLKVFYEKEDLPAGVKEKDLKLFYLKEGRWVKIGGVANTHFGYLEVSITQLGNYAIFIDSEEEPKEIGGIYLTSNPFSPNEDGINDTTEIHFMVFKEGLFSSLDIYTSEGEKVITLLEEEELLSGENFLVWDGKDREGKFVPSGIYIYRLRARDPESGWIDTEKGVIAVVR